METDAEHRQFVSEPEPSWEMIESDEEYQPDDDPDELTQLEAMSLAAELAGQSAQEPDDSPRPHPAKFSESILLELGDLLPTYLPDGARILDPFAGIGGIHDLRPRWETWGIELEAEWADQSPYTSTGNALEIATLADLGWDAIVTSPAYGNRMADKYDGRDGSRRHTYRIDLGRELADSNGAAMQWGPEYRGFHAAAWRAAALTIRPGGHIVLNVKNHIRKEAEQRVSEWHAEWFLNAGFSLREVRRVATPGMKHGQNGEARVNGELLMVFQDTRPAVTG